MTRHPLLAESARDFGGYPGYAGPRHRGYTTEALYVSAQDGTGLAIDVHLPKGLPEDAKIPTVMRVTRYWRAISLRWPASLFDRDEFVDFFTSNPQRAVIGAWSHGARGDADPFKPVDAPLWPSKSDQMLDCLRFLDHYLKGVDNGVMSEKLLHYYTAGEGRWKTTAVWPPEGTAMHRWYLAEEHGFSEAPPLESEGSDEYAVDWSATSGTTNRWYTQLDGSDVVYDRCAEQVSKLLCYRSEPLARDMEITGHAVVMLRVRSTHEDGAFYVYLDAEAPDARIVYLTDGQLRALHRKVSQEKPPYRIWEPYHSFERADGAPLVPGEVSELSFGLQPTSALIPKGWRLRVSTAGHDADNFARIPAEGDPVITVERNLVHESYLELPVVGRGGG